MGMLPGVKQEPLRYSKQAAQQAARPTCPFFGFPAALPPACASPAAPAALRLLPALPPAACPSSPPSQSLPAAAACLPALPRLAGAAVAVAVAMALPLAFLPAATCCTVAPWPSLAAAAAAASAAAAAVAGSAAVAVAVAFLLPRCLFALGCSSSEAAAGTQVHCCQKPRYAAAAHMVHIVTGLVQQA